jgi:hypothetical protein
MRSSSGSDATGTRPTLTKFRVAALQTHWSVSLISGVVLRRHCSDENNYRVEKLVLYLRYYY